MSVAFFLFSVLILAFQTTLMQSLPSWLGRPDLLFLLLLFIAFYFPFVSGLILTLLLGGLMDTFSGIYPGMYAFCFLFIFLLIYYMSRRLVLDEPAHQMVVAMLAFLAFAVLMNFLIIVVAPETVGMWSWHHILQNTVILGVLSLPFFALCRGLKALVVGLPKMLGSRLKPRSGNTFRR